MKILLATASHKLFDGEAESVLLPTIRGEAQILPGHTYQRAVKEVKQRLAAFSLVAILGARQTGKTTLARQIPSDFFFDLENPRHLAQLEQPQLALEKLEGTIVIDEIQRKPDLFPLIRTLVDDQAKRKFLILGSASRELIRQSSEFLARRIAYYNLSGFSLAEVGADKIDLLWVQGGLPLSFLPAREAQSRLWRDNYITTFLERDLPQLGIQIPATTLRKFWMMLSHYHGKSSIIPSWLVLSAFRI